LEGLKIALEAILSPSNAIKIALQGLSKFFLKKTQTNELFSNIYRSHIKF
jgi:hypothetical protein